MILNSAVLLRQLYTGTTEKNGDSSIHRAPLHVYYVSKESKAGSASFLSSWEEGRNGNEPLLTEALYSLHPKEGLTVKDIQIIYCKMTVHLWSLTYHLFSQNFRKGGIKATSQNVSCNKPRKSASSIYHPWDAMALIWHQFINVFLAAKIYYHPKKRQ